MQRDFLEELGIESEKIDLILSETEKLSADFNAAKKEYDDLMSSVRSEKIHTAIKNAGGKNIAAVEALLDTGRLEFDGLNVHGIEEELERIRQENDFLFTQTAIPHIVDETNGTYKHYSEVRRIMGIN